MINKWFLYNKKKVFWVVTISIQILIIIIIGLFCLVKEKKVVTISTEKDLLSRYIQIDSEGWSVYENDYIEVDESEKRVDLLYGPYIMLPKGAYDLVITYKSDRNQLFDIHSFENDDKIVAYEPVLSATDSSMSPGEKYVDKIFHFYLKDSVNDLETRFQYNGKGYLSIKSVAIKTSTFVYRIIFGIIIFIFLFLDFILYYGYVFLKIQFEEKKKIALAMLVTFAIFFVAIRFFGLQYLVNDDATINDILRGGENRLPYPYPQFINVILGWGMCLLYVALPNVNWWLLWSLFCLFAGFSMLHYTIIRMADNLYFSFFSIGTLAVIYEMFMISHISFTIVPAIFSFGAVSLLYIQMKKKSIDVNLLCFIGAIVLISSFHRSSSIDVVFCFFFLSLCICIYKQGYKNKRNYVIYLCVICLTYFLCSFINVASSKVLSNVNDSGFYAMSSARSGFTDYPHKTFEEVSEIYEKYGWDYEDYFMIERCGYITDGYNVTSLQGIANEVGVKNDVNIVLDIIREQLCESFFLIKEGAHFNYKNGIVGLTFLYICVICAAIILMKKAMWIAFALMDIAGGSILLLYLYFKGRFLYRAEVIVCFPMLCVLVFIFLLCNKNNLNCKIDNGKALQQLFAVTCLFSIILLPTYFVFEEGSYRHSLELTKAIREYGELSPNSIFIVSDDRVISENVYDPIPDNMFFWGNGEWNSSAMRLKLAYNELEEITLETLMEDNVYYIGNYQNEIKKKIEKTLGKVDMKLDGNIGELGVWKYE